jgi:hypothetical protein
MPDADVPPPATRPDDGPGADAPPSGDRPDTDARPDPGATVEPGSGPTAAPRSERRRYLIAGVAMALVLVGLALLVGLLADDPPRSQQRPQENTAEKPQMIPQPGTGRAPEQPGDPGGWQQLAVLVVMVAGMAVLAALAWRSSVRARKRYGTAAQSKPATIQKQDTRS